MERMIGSIGWWLAVAAVLDLGGLSGGMRAWWRTLIGSTLLQGVVLVLGAVVAAPPWLTLCIAHVCGAIVLAVQLLRHQQRVRGATGWKNAMQLTWQLLRTNSRQLWASLPQRWRRAWTWWQYTGQYLLPWQQWLVWSVLLVTGIAALAPESSILSSESMAARLADVTRALGGPLLMFLVIVETILVAAGLVRVTDFMFRTMKRIAVFTWLLAIVAHVGPAFEDVAQQSPTDAALLAGALVLVVSVVRQVPIQLQPAALGRTATTPGVDSVHPGIPYRQPAIDRETCAIHEAGHALLYATPLPWHPDITAVVHAVPHHGRGGYVTAPFWDQMDTNVVMTEWHMLLCLSGQAAEHALLGTSCMGSGDDYQRWHALAMNYIANGHGPTAPPRPMSKAEQVRHDQALMTLRTEQRELLTLFFAVNRDVLQDLSDALCKRQILHTNDLQSFWERVTIPEGFPRPTWTHINNTN